MTAGPDTTDFARFGCNGFAGAEKASVALLGGLRENRCAAAGSDNQVPCLRGSVPAVECAEMPVTAAQGPCRDAYVAAAAGGDVFASFYDTASPIGVANNLYACESRRPCNFCR